MRLRGPGRRALRLAFSLGGGKVEREGRAHARLAGNGDGALERLHDAVNDGQSETSTRADGLGGEERVEDPFQRRGVHPVAGVADDEPSVPARSQVGVGAGGVHADAIDADRDVAGLALHRVPCIRAEVQEHPVDIVGVGEDVRDILGTIDREFHIRGQRGP